MARRIDLPDGPASSRESERLDDLPEGHPSSPKYGADGPKLTYWERIGDFDRQWAQHERRWPKPEQADKIRPGERSLSPEQNAQADREIAKMREPEKSITVTLQQIELQNTYGGVLAGLKHRLKGDERLKDKIAGSLNEQVGNSVADAAGEIWDAVRYTFVFDRDSYVSGYRDISARLETAGCRMAKSGNNWLDNLEYKGINTRWITPEGGRFELQFHTPESLDAKENRTHRAYERIRSPETTRAEQRELQAYQRLVSAAIPVPGGVEAIRRA